MLTWTTPYRESDGRLSSNVGSLYWQAIVVSAEPVFGSDTPTEEINNQKHSMDVGQDHLVNWTATK